MITNEHVKPALKDLTEREILIALKNHDELVIRNVYQTNWPMILQMVRLNNGDASEAKDLFQESMLDFLEKVWNEKFILTCKISTFIYSICRKKWLYKLRGRQRFIDIEEYKEIEDFAQEAVEEDIPLPDDSQISQAIHALGEPCKTLLIGFYYQKMSMDELSAMLHYKSTHVAKQQKFRCKDRLKNSFSGFFKNQN